MTTDELRSAANRLRQSERGQRVLTKLIELYEAGAPCLDEGNKSAAIKLITAMLSEPWHWPAELHGKEEAVK